jgi:hypothetical protein
MSINFAFFARLIFKGRSLVCKESKVRRFPAFSFSFFHTGASRVLSICSFASMQKNHKN